MQSQSDGINRFFCLFFFCNADDFCFYTHVEIIVNLTVWNGTGKDSRNNFIALLHQRFDNAGDRVVVAEAVKNLCAADHLKIVFSGNNRVKRIGFML